MCYIRYNEHKGKSPEDHHSQNTLLCHMQKKLYIRYHEHTGKSPEDHHSQNTLLCHMQKSCTYVTMGILASHQWIMYPQGSSGRGIIISSKMAIIYL